MPNVRIGEAFHKLDGTPYGTGKSLFVTERKSVMVKQIKISNFTEVKNIMNAATHCVDEIGVHDGKGSIADAKSILGLMSLACERKRKRAAARLRSHQLKTCETDKRGVPLQARLFCYSPSLRYSITSDTGQSKIKHRVSSVFSVMVSPCFMRCRVLAETPCLKINWYSVMFFRYSVR